MNDTETRMNTDLLPRDGRILCAVSGGVDSMYLLCRLLELGYDVAVGHYNHRLRGRDSDDDQRFVARFCQSRSVPFFTESGDVAAYAREHRLSLEEAARNRRYDFLERAAEKAGANLIATAHTADDNLETILFHLVRGTGLKGLGGIPPVRGRFVRPMLTVTRQQAEEYLAAHAIPHVEDATNHRDDYTRNRLRHGVVPLLAKENPQVVRAAMQTAWLLRQDEEHLDKEAEAFLTAHRTKNTLPLEPFLALDWPIASRVMRRMAGRELSYAHCQAIWAAANRGGCVDVAGMRVRQGSGRVVFGPENAPKLADHTLIPGEAWTLLPAGLVVKCEKLPKYPQDVHKSFNIFYFKYENICGSIILGARRPGDKLRPAGRGCTKPLKQLFQEGNIPPWERDSIPVLRDDQGPLAVYGLAVAQRAAAQPGDGNILKVEFIPQEGG
jgi:tRNA(Ile)-lysidine synthase